MSLTFEDRDRSTVPRWRDFYTTATTGELDSKRKMVVLVPSDDVEMTVKKQDWLETRSLAFAGDFLSSAVVLSRQEEALDAAEFIFKLGDSAPYALASLAKSVLGIGSSEPIIGDQSATQRIWARIHKLKQTLKEDPRNAIALVNMSRAYTLIGQAARAEQKMHRALMLAPDNRFVLRSATRLYIHKNAPDKAAGILRHCKGLIYDPWLMSAEIAVSTVLGVDSRYIKEGHSALSKRTFSSFDLTELASSLATVDLYAGNSKGARKLFGQSLKDPNDNALAQAGWASKHITGIEVPRAPLDRPFFYEARAREFYFAHEWKRTVEACEEWHLDEPFASRSACLGAYLAAVALGDNALAEKLAVQGLRANPTDPMLLNNLTVALARSGRLAEAIERFSQIQYINDDNDSNIAYIATQGLLFFRAGRLEEGRQYYEKAETIAREMTWGRLGLSPQGLVAAALLHWSFEELEAKTAEFDIVFTKAKEAMRHLPVDQTGNPQSPELLELQKRIEVRSTQSRNAPQERISQPSFRLGNETIVLPQVQRHIR